MAHIFLNQENVTSIWLLLKNPDLSLLTSPSHMASEGRNDKQLPSERMTHGQLWSWVPLHFCHYVPGSGILSFTQKFVRSCGGPENSACPGSAVCGDRKMNSIPWGEQWKAFLFGRQPQLLLLAPAWHERQQLPKSSPCSQDAPSMLPGQETAATLQMFPDVPR